jgi:hypothetical protein
MLPFTATQFLDVFGMYNTAIWPAQLVAYVLALGALALIATRRPASLRIAVSILALLWFWNGVTYHLFYFSRINPAAYGFAALFIAQSLLFLLFAVRREDPTPATGWGPARLIGALMIAYALVVYNVLGTMLGHSWPRVPVFGVAPCPTTIFTLGLLMLSAGSVPFWLLAIPLVWAAIGSSAAVLLSVREDLGLVVAGLAAAIWLIASRSQASNVG